MAYSSTVFQLPSAAQGTRRPLQMKAGGSSGRHLASCSSQLMRTNGGSQFLRGMAATVRLHLLNGPLPDAICFTLACRCALMAFIYHACNELRGGYFLTGSPILRHTEKRRVVPCGATGTQMNLFSRLFRVARSYANSIGEWP